MQYLLKTLGEVRTNALCGRQGVHEFRMLNSLFNKGMVNEGIAAEKLDLPPVTELAETTQIARDLLLAQKTGVHYHICHVSTKTSVELVRLAKARGIKVLQCF